MTGPMATPRPENPAQMAMARPRSRGSRNTLVRIDRVDGMISAPPTPIRQRAAMSWFGVPDSADSTEPVAKMMMPVRSGQLAAEAVAEAAGGEQQAGEHERVAVDDPLHLAVGRAELVDQAGDGHVEDRVVHHDDQQADAQRAEREPAPGVDVRVELVDIASSYVNVGLSVLIRAAPPLFRYGTVPYRNQSSRAVSMWPPSHRRHVQSSRTTSSHSWVVSASDSVSTRSSLPWNRVPYSPGRGCGLNSPAP